MTEDMSDAWREIRALQDEVRRLRSEIKLENSSITNGRLRFIGGLLLIDSGGTLTVVGHLNGEGDFVWDGPWALKGKGKITGDVDTTGNVTSQGEFTQNGNGSINGATVLNGTVTIPGSAPIVLRTTDGVAAIDVGDGRIRGVTGGMALGAGESQIIASTGGAMLLLGGNSVSVTADGVSLAGVPDLPTGTDAQYLVIDATGRLYKSAGVGGGSDPTPGEDLGRFMWPFALSTVTSEYGPRDGRIHEGIDFGNAPALAGAAIPAAGDGVVAVNTFSSGWGNYVRITHDVNGTQMSTLYAHMVSPGLPPVGSTVSKGEVIGNIGNTGNSRGAHLHFETWMTTSYGSHINPRNFMAAYGPG